ncbi:MAG: hypothetical protein GWP09_01325 [Nitrospiraceae bacterium]|nr:hypothetical protein [Nitrospiraceae bacterium]
MDSILNKIKYIAKAYELKLKFTPSEYVSSVVFYRRKTNYNQRNHKNESIKFFTLNFELNFEKNLETLIKKFYLDDKDILRQIGRDLKKFPRNEVISTYKEIRKSYRGIFKSEMMNQFVPLWNTYAKLKDNHSHEGEFGELTEDMGYL